MAAKQSSQKFIARNRAPRVQIEYDLETYKGVKKINLPFVMGVLGDMSGKPAEPLGPLQEREFREVDVGNFDEAIKKAKPRVAFQVPNELTGKGNISVDITFESMEDFSPAAVAQKVDALKQLLDTRTQLKELLVKIDGKGKAEDLLAQLLNDRPLLQALADSQKEQNNG